MNQKKNFKSIPPKAGDAQSDPLLESLVSELITKFKCHTVLLYGSRARGDATELSDYDLAGIKKSGKKFRVARKQNGAYIDIFIFSETDLQKVDEGLLYMDGAKVLHDDFGFGASLIRKIHSVAKRKHKPLSENEIEVRKVWLHKMFERTQINDIEGHYRRAWLQEALLVEYFNIRKRRYLGSKQSFAWLKENDPSTFRLFARALENPLDSRCLKKLVERVSG